MPKETVKAGDYIEVTDIGIGNNLIPIEIGDVFKVAEISLERCMPCYIIDLKQPVDGVNKKIYIKTFAARKYVPKPRNDPTQWESIIPGIYGRIKSCYLNNGG